MLKKTLKQQAEKIVSKIGRHNWKLPGETLLILTYHRILPNDYTELATVQPGMAVFERTFRMHVKILRDRFELVHLSDWCEKVRSRMSLPKKACAITLDDGWRDNFEHAFPILDEERAPATIFLVSDMVGASKSFWPERLARFLWGNGYGQPRSIWNNENFMWIRALADRDFANGPPSRDEIDTIISRAKCFTDDVLERKLDLMEVQLGVSYRARQPDTLDWHQVQKMKETGLIEFGSHSRHHVRLSGSVNEQTILDEVQGSKYILERKLGCTVKTFCYPNGDMTPAAIEAVRHNYIAACTTVSGWNSRQSDPHILKRIGIHQDIASNERAFLARLSGWF